MSDQKPYAPPPNMQVPYDNENRTQSGYPQQSGYAQPSGYSQQSGYPQPGYPQPHPVAFAPYAPSGGLPPPDMHMPNTIDTDPIVKGFEFNTESIRRGFIRKVYSILSIQLLVTLGVVMAFVHHSGTREFAFHNYWLLIVSLLLVLVTLITLSCCDGVRRTSPNNMIFLGLFTIGESICVGYCTLAYEPGMVMIAVLMTAVVVIALTVFAFQTKWDFTMMGGVLFVALMIMFVFSLMFMFMPRTRTTELIFSSFGALLFSAYLIHDTQLIIGGDHKYSISPEEYVMGAITLFLDIINIFLHILRILSAATKN